MEIEFERYTGIQWTHVTVNFWTGCEKVSEGCKYCYMFRGKERYHKDPTEVVKVHRRTILAKLKDLRPGSLIFTCSWSDFFHEKGDVWRAEAWDIIRAHPQFRWQILTKRPERINECLPADWGANGWPQVWLGFTAENQERLEQRAAHMAGVRAWTKFISAEPLLGPLDFNFKVRFVTRRADILMMPVLQVMDWVILGGESGNDTGKYLFRPSELGWFLSAINQCKQFDTPVFFKQTGTGLSKELGMKDRHGGVFEELPAALQIRQMPKRYEYECINKSFSII